MDIHSNAGRYGDVIRSLPHQTHCKVGERKVQNR